MGGNVGLAEAYMDGDWDSPNLPDFLTVDQAWQTVAALRRAADYDGTALRERFGLPGSMRLGECSAGQRARAELGAALAGDPPILLFDEPFSHLDTQGVDDLQALLDELRSSRCILLIAHRLMDLVVDSVVMLER